MDVPDLSDVEVNALQAVHAERNVDIYDLAQAVGIGPKTATDAVQILAEHRLVIVTDRGRHVRCTPAGDEVARGLQPRTKQDPDEQRGGPGH